MNNESKKSTDIKKEESYQELLEKYNEQSKEDAVHSYSEVLHHDYSDSDCCC